MPSQIRNQQPVIPGKPAACHSGQKWDIFSTQHVIPGKNEKMGHFFNFDPESTDAITDQKSSTCQTSSLSFRAKMKKWDIFSNLTRNPLMPSQIRNQQPVIPGKLTRNPPIPSQIRNQQPVIPGKFEKIINLSFRAKMKKWDIFSTQHVIPGKNEKMGHFFNFDPESTDAVTDQKSATCHSGKPAACHSGQKWDIFSTQPVIPGKNEKMGHFFNFDPESTDAITDQKPATCHSGKPAACHSGQK
ncbi:hypothetical protein QUF72_04990 [Desulfobacterales bacterium HSG2]|nr:hypothetical protein [Desulfobacterales bacterium HSG2]